jgi:hypothetical protein
LISEIRSRCKVEPNAIVISLMQQQRRASGAKGGVRSGAENALSPTMLA